jgi:hypothetical protein
VSVWMIVLVVLYVLIGLDNVVEGSFTSKSNSWSRAADFFLWPLQAFVGVYNVAWIIYDVRKSARKEPRE